jgi:hypothetical protein
MGFIPARTVYRQIRETGSSLGSPAPLLHGAEAPRLKDHPTSRRHHGRRASAVVSSRWARLSNAAIAWAVTA